MDIVLCGHRNEGMAFLRERGLRQHQAKIITSRSSLQGIRPKVAYVLPGFERNPMRHAIRSALRFIRPTPEYIQVGEEPTREEIVESEGTRDALAILAADVDPAAAARVAADLARAKGA